MTVYIAGGITGVEDYKARFAAAKRMLLRKGEDRQDSVARYYGSPMTDKVLSPAELPEDWPGKVYMDVCLAMIRAAALVVFLPGWEQSRGASSAEEEPAGLRTVCDTLPGRRDRDARRRESQELADGRIWAAEPGVCRVVDGLPCRVERIRALGNAVVPQQAYPIFRALAEELNRQERSLTAAQAGGGFVSSTDEN